MKKNNNQRKIIICLATTFKCRLIFVRLVSQIPSRQMEVMDSKTTNKTADCYSVAYGL